MSIHVIDPIKHNVPATLLSVRDNNNHISHFCAGYADVRNETLLTPDFLFPNDKITQIYTAIVALKLVEAGLIDLDWPLELIANRYQLDGGRLKILVNLYSFLKPLTLRVLLHQTSGLPAYDETVQYQKIFFSNPKKKWQAENYLDVISGQNIRFRLGYEPPLKGVFSDATTNYVVASWVLEAVTGRKNSAQMHELFTAIGLKNTFYMPYGVLDQKLLPRLMHGYLPLSHPHADVFQRLPVLTYHHNRELCVFDVTNAYNFQGLGAKASLGTTTDLIHTISALVKGKILRSTFKEMFDAVPVSIKNNPSDDKTYFGLGIYKTISRRYGEIIWQAGNSYGYGVLIAHAVDRDITFAMATNVSRQYISLQNQDIINEVLQQVLG